MARCLVVLFLAVAFSAQLRGQVRSAVELCGEPEIHESIQQYWADIRPLVLSTIEQSATETYSLYHTQDAVHLLLWYAFRHKNYGLIDDVLEVLLTSATTTDTLNRYLFKYGGPNEDRDTVLTLQQRHIMWVDGTDPRLPKEENILASSLYLHMVSQVVFYVVQTPDSLRSPTMKRFATTFSPILNSHYQRWVVGTSVLRDKNIPDRKLGPFQRKGWGCKYADRYVPSQLNHTQLVEYLMGDSCGNGASKRYCNAVTDVDLFVISGVSNYVAAYLVDTALIAPPSNLYHLMHNYLPVANALIESRLDLTINFNFSDSAVVGTVFDRGIWQDHFDQEYAANLNQDSIPNPQDTARVADIGWDISHGRRFVTTFQSLFETKELLGFAAPNCHDMRQLANQFIYTVYNRDSLMPLFSNYMNGSNGWYRVGYQNRVNFGYGPSDLSLSALTGGYGFWSDFNPDMVHIMQRLNTMLASKVEMVRGHVMDHFEANHWENDPFGAGPYRPDEYEFVFPVVDTRTKLDLLKFYCSLCTASNPTCNELNPATNATMSSLFQDSIAGTLNVIGADPIQRLTILDSLGQSILNINPNAANVVVNVATLPVGSYIVRVRIEELWYDRVWRVR